MNNTEEIGIVVLNYNNAKETIKLVNNLILNLDNSFKIIIIDNNSKDKEVLNKYSEENNFDQLIDIKSNIINDKSRVLFYFSDQNKGYAGGNNLGLSYCINNSMNYAFILNPDVIVSDFEVFNILVHFLKRNNEAGIVSPKVIMPNGKTQGVFHRIGNTLSLINFLFPISTFFIKLYRLIELKLVGYNSVYTTIGCFYALNLIIIKKINYLDERTFLYLEEQIIAEKLKLSNYKFCYLPQISIIHDHNYEKTPVLNPYFEESYNYYINNYLKLSKLSQHIYKISKKHRDSLSNFLYTFASLLSKIFNR